jgi:hypothetical protein
MKKVSTIAGKAEQENLAAEVDRLTLVRHA